VNKFLLNILFAVGLSIGLAQQSPGAPNNPGAFVKYTPQTLTPAQKTQAQTNIGITGGAPVASSDLLGTIAIKARNGDHGSWLLGDGRPISRVTSATFFNALAPTFNLITTAASTSADVNLVDGRQLSVGLALEGPGVTAGTTVTAISSFGLGQFVGGTTQGGNTLAVNTYDQVLSGASAISNQTLLTNAALPVGTRVGAPPGTQTITTAGTHSAVAGTPFLGTFGGNLGSAGLVAGNITARAFLGPLSVASSVLGLGYEPRMEYGTNSISGPANGYRTSSLANTLFANWITFYTAPVQAQMYQAPVANVPASPTIGYTFSATGNPQPGSLIGNSPWVGAVQNQFVPQLTVPNFTTQSAVLIGATAIPLTLTSASSYPTLVGTQGQPNQGDIVRIAGRAYQITNADYSGANVVITIHSPLTTGVPAGDTITGLGRAAVLSTVAHPTATAAIPSGINPGGSFTVALTGVSDFIPGDLIKPFNVPTLACIITSIAGNNVTCTATAGTTANNGFNAGERFFRAIRFTLRQPTSQTAPTLNTTFATALNTSTILILNTNVPANVNAVSGAFTLGGAVTITQAATSSTPGSSPGNTAFLTAPNVTLSANALSTGTNLTRGFPFGRGDGSTTFNIPDCKGKLLSASGFNGTQTQTLGANLTIGNATAVGQALVAGNCFVYAGP
jgi:hypothetical protein